MSIGMRVLVDQMKRVCRSRHGRHEFFIQKKKMSFKTDHYSTTVNLHSEELERTLFEQVNEYTSPTELKRLITKLFDHEKQLLCEEVHDE